MLEHLGPKTQLVTVSSRGLDLSCCAPAQHSSSLHHHCLRLATFAGRFVSHPHGRSSSSLTVPMAEQTNPPMSRLASPQGPIDCPELRTAFTPFITDSVYFSFMLFNRAFGWFAMNFSFALTADPAETSMVLSFPCGAMNVMTNTLSRPGMTTVPPPDGPGTGTRTTPPGRWPQ